MNEKRIDVISESANGEIRGHRECVLSESVLVNKWAQRIMYTLQLEDLSELDQLTLAGYLVDAKETLIMASEILDEYLHDL